MPTVILVSIIMCPARKVNARNGETRLRRSCNKLLLYIGNNIIIQKGKSAILDPRRQSILMRKSNNGQEYDI